MSSKKKSITNKKSAAVVDLPDVGPGSVVIVPYGQSSWPAVITSITGSGPKAKASYYHLPVYSDDYKFHCPLSKVKPLKADTEKPKVVDRYANDMEQVWPEAMDMLSWSMDKCLNLLENRPERPRKAEEPPKPKTKPRKPREVDAAESSAQETDGEGEIDPEEAGADLLEDPILGQEIPLSSKIYKAGSDREKRDLTVSETIFQGAELDVAALPDTIVLIKNPFGNGLWPAIYLEENEEARIYRYQPFPRHIRDGRERRDTAAVNTAEKKVYKFDASLVQASIKYAMKKDSLLYEALCDLKNYLIEKDVWDRIEQQDKKFLSITVRPVYVNLQRHSERAKALAKKAAGGGDATDEGGETEEETDNGDRQPLADITETVKVEGEMFEEESETAPELETPRPIQNRAPRNAGDENRSIGDAESSLSSQATDGRVINDPPDDEPPRLTRHQNTLVIRDGDNKLVDAAPPAETMLRRPPAVAVAETRHLRESLAARPLHKSKEGYRFQEKVPLPILKLEFDELTSPEVTKHFEELWNGAFPQHDRFLKKLQFKDKWFPATFGWEVPLAGFVSLDTAADVVDSFAALIRGSLHLTLDGKRKDLGDSPAFCTYYATYVMLYEAIIFVLTKKFKSETSKDYKRPTIENLLEDASAYMDGQEKGIELGEYLERIRTVIPPGLWKKGSLLEQSSPIKAAEEDKPASSRKPATVKSEVVEPMEIEKTDQAAVVKKEQTAAGKAQKSSRKDAKPTSSQQQNEVFPDVDLPLSPAKGTPSPKTSPTKRATRTDSRIPVKRSRRK